MRYTAPPYMHDVLPHPPAKDPWLHSARWRFVEEIFRETCRRYGCLEIRTPILEQTELFTRSIGEASDIVSKEMFTFTDRGGRSMTLKPESTAPVVRSCIENKLFAAHPLLKLFYIGQHFRYERGQRGRYRQHQQLGVEAFGSADPALDAEVILLAMDFFTALGIEGQELRINSVGTPASRPAYREALRDYVRPFLNEMTEEGQHRFEANPLRMLDTKDENEIRLLENAPHMLDYLDDESATHFDRLTGYLKAAGVPYVVDHRLVRGFDYYTRTAFEVVSGRLGSQNALGGGGRYDGLVEECGGAAVPGIGFGIGMERCMLALEAMSLTGPTPAAVSDIFLVTLGDDASVRPAAVRLLREIRQLGIAADMSYGSRKFPQQMKRADELGARIAVILGEDEVARGVARLRDQATKQEWEVALDLTAAAAVEAAAL